MKCEAVDEEALDVGACMDWKGFYRGITWPFIACNGGAIPVCLCFGFCVLIAVNVVIIILGAQKTRFCMRRGEKTHGFGQPTGGHLART